MKMKRGDEMAQDWSGDENSVYKIIGASNHSNENRADDDYYATDPKAVEELLKREKFSHYVWEPACGGGHISKVLEAHGYDVLSSDIVDRGYPNTYVANFLRTKPHPTEYIPRDIITNPPYKYAKEFVEKALKLSMDSTKIAMFLKLTFLEGKARRELFDKAPPKYVYVFSGRVNCAKNGDFSKAESSAVAYAWFVWEKGFKGEPKIRWI